MNETQYRNQWLRRHRQYEKLAYREFVKGFKELGNSIPWGFITEENYELILDTNFKQEMFYNIYFNVYREIGIIHGKRVGKEINKQIKEFTLNAFLSTFERNLLEFLLNNVTNRVISVRRTYLDTLKDLILNGVQDGKTMSQIVTEIQKKINQRGFYRWQIMRIVRTETTASANYASTVAGDVSGVALDKIWISATDSRTRRIPRNKFDHLSMNGVRVPKNEMFEIPTINGTEKVVFPGDPKASAGNVINCRCNSALVPRRDKNGRIIRL